MHSAILKTKIESHQHVISSRLPPRRRGFAPRLLLSLRLDEGRALGSQGEKEWYEGSESHVAVMKDVVRRKENDVDKIEERKKKEIRKEKILIEF